MPIRIFTFILTFLVVYNLHAQVYLFNENFNQASGTNPPGGWTTQLLYGQQTVDSFRFFDTLYHFGGGIKGSYALFDSYNAGVQGGTFLNSYGEETVLISPAINASDTINLFLSFDYYLHSRGTQIHVDVSGNNGNSWNTVWTRSTSTNKVINRELNISSYAGSSQLKFRFRWENPTDSTTHGYCAFDNAEVYFRKEFDAGIQSIIPLPSVVCEQGELKNGIILTNEGYASFGDIAVELNYTGAIDTSFAMTVSSPAVNDTTWLRFSSLFPDTSGMIYLQAVLSSDTDEHTLNDTLYYVFEVMPKPGKPQLSAIDRCGAGPMTLISDSSGIASTHWFTDSLGSALLGVGDTIVSPLIPVRDTFFAQNIRGSSRVISTFQGPYRFSGSPSGGCFFNIEADIDISIDSISQLLAYAGSGLNIKVFTKNGSYQGYEANQAVWTEHISLNLNAPGFGKYVTFDVPDILMRAGETKAFYITVAGGNSPTFKHDTLNISNSDLRISGYSINNTLFGGTLFQSYSWDGKVHYKSLCLSETSKVVAEVTALPSGLTLNKGKIFEGEYRNGTIGMPDIIYGGKTASYTLPAPSGYLWTDYGVDWVITSLTLTSDHGTPISASDTSMYPGNAIIDGRLDYFPPLSWSDSTLLLNVRIQDLNTNCDTLLNRVIFIAPKPVLDFNYTKLCLGDATEFQNLSQISSGTVSYFWYFGDGDSANQMNPTHQYSNFGSYQVRLLGISNFGYKSDTTLSLTIKEVPVADFSVKYECEGTALLFTNKSSISNGSMNYFWEFGDGFTSTNINAFHLYSTVGNYTVKLTSGANGCQSSISKPAYQFPVPQASFIHDSLCSNNPALFTATSTISDNSNLAATWNFGDLSGSQSGKNINHSYADSGSYIVRLITVSQFNCRDTIFKTVNVRKSPELSFEVQNLCDQSPARFINTSISEAPLKSYYWEFGDGDTSAQKDPQHLYPDVGFYTVSLESEDIRGCYSSTETEVYIGYQPLADFSISDSCANSDILFSNLTENVIGMVNFQWDFGDGDSSDEFSPHHRYDSLGGNYTVGLRAIGGNGCSSFMEYDLRIHPSPICTFNNVQIDGNLYRFEPDTSPVEIKSYIWTFSDGSSSTQASPSRNIDSNIQITLTLESVNNCYCTYTRWFNDSTKGIREMFPNFFSVYPNPASQSITVNFKNHKSSQFRIVLINAMGQVVKNIELPVNQGKMSVDISGVETGVYYLKVGNDEWSAIQRVVILGI